MRSSPLIEYSSTVLLLCLWVGAITTVFSSVIGLFQQDIKKVIAYSTMSQLALEYIYFLIIFLFQTICEKIIFNNLNKILFIINSQITKAHDYLYNHISINLFNSSLTILWQYYYIFKNIIMSVRWKIYTISKLVGISEAICLILIFFKFNINLNLKSIFNLNNSINYYGLFPQKKKISFFRHYHLSAPNFNSNNIDQDQNKKKKELAFIQWLAGLIDGDGYFILTKKGYTSCEITMDYRDKKVLYEIKQKYGGSIKTISNANALRYKLRHKKGLISLINDVNGHLRNPARLLQFNKLCVKYGLELKYAEPLTFNNGWLSGFIDSDGSIYYSEASGQVFISITQKNKYLLEPLINIYGGRIDILSPKLEAFKYIVYRKLELFNLIDNYFSKYPLKTAKIHRLNLVKDFYCLRLYRKSEDINKFNEWIKFKDKWEKYKD